MVEINPADLFRLVAGPHGGLEGATGPEEALSRLISGAAQPDDIRGYDPERACNLHEFAGVVLEPARILESKQEPGRWLYVRELGGNRVLVAEFREAGGGRLSLTEFRLQDAVDLEAEPLEVKWTPADPSRPAGSAGLSGGEAPSPGSSSNVYATSWTERRPNLDPEIWASLTARMGRPVGPEEFLAYVYAVLYTPAYREKYAEFLRVDFPRVPLPESESTFSAFAAEGAPDRAAHPGGERPGSAQRPFLRRGRGAGRKAQVRGGRAADLHQQDPLLRAGQPRGLELPHWRLPGARKVAQGP